MIKIIPMWRLKNKSDATEMNDALVSLKDNVSSFLDIEVGINTSEHQAAYDIVLIGSFATRSDLSAFDNDKAHGEVGDLVHKIKDHRVVIEYEI